MYNFPEDPALGERANGLEWDGNKWIAVWPTLDDSNFVLKNVTEEQIVAGPLTAESFKGRGEEITHLLTDQLADVNSENADRDDILVFNGSIWEATEFAFVDTTIQFKGGLDVTDSALYPTEFSNGDLYIADTDGIVAPEWVGIGGTPVNTGNFIGYAESKLRWYLVGDLASGAVTRVGAGTGTDVDDSKPAEPVVSIDRTEVDTWYEPKFAKLSAFNKNFGTTAGTVSEGNHLHSQYITAAPVTSVNSKTGAVVLAHGDVGAAAASHTHAYSPTNHTHSEYSPTSHNHNGVYQPAGSYAASNHNHSGVYQPAGSYAASNHNHSGVYAPASHSHSYVPLSGNSAIAGTLTATDFTITSDARYKGSVRTLDGQKVYDMRGVSYTHLETGEQSSGVIAQELRQVAPELVLEDDGGYLSVAYPKLVGYLIEAIKNQKEEIDELRQAIEDMR